MPTPELWSLVVQDSKLYVKLGGKVLVEHGPVISVQCHKQKLHHIKVTVISSNLLALPIVANCKPNDVHTSMYLYM